MSDERRKKRKFFDDIFDEGGFEDIEDMIENIIKRFGVDMEDLSEHPFVYGFSLTQKPGEDPEIREFGNVTTETNNDAKGHEISIDERKPLIDVMETDDSVHIIAEMPGIEKKDIDISATASFVELRGSRGERKYFEHVNMPFEVDPNSAKATYKNGVLEVIFQRSGSESKVSIDIE